MRFWRENRVDGEFEMPVAEVAAAFTAAVEGRSMRNAGSTWWPEKLEQLELGESLETLLRDWLTSKDGLNSVWEAEHPGGHFTYCLVGCSAVRHGTHMDACPSVGQTFDDLYVLVRAAHGSPRVVTAEIDTSEPPTRSHGPDYSANHVS